MTTTSLERLLAQAEEICLQRNVRLTPQRMEVLRLMACQKGTISAYDLLDLLRVSEPQAKPPTIYRALDFLLEQGFIHKVESTNSYVMCHHIEEPSHTSALFICHRCGQVTEQTTQDVQEHLEKLAALTGFSLQHSVVEAHGLCRDCGKIESCDNRDTCHHDHSEPKKKNSV
ncbi:zinc uptake transcriptional repressor Zur [Hafnia alvei]|uniref:zinc uptake transcriptional repressor Zur n=1 Tax=Hafnia alvei TaxID=569 RepID=UPI0006229E41|nr:zinc uptake transcriptional repressor Zur [Hafnia alvei]KKI46345.1 zinc uptake transcriptional repressor [Hafnia alvei]